ncbi:hypothetical protein CH370_18635 [Leptospira kmetyi]|uniref:hypothetical protein n=1 Tax=Leptospira kmetyi TaxID=408139 RepID=UPI000C2AC933|nr:hypothetical protein [Leptospira kmetyi]PJZ39949.1 hypothetical protein CH370_18635 [Leptospira kmetyi]
MYLKEGLRSHNPIENKIFVKTISLNQDDFEFIKEDVNNFTDTKVTKMEIESIDSLSLKSKIGFLLIIGSRKRDSKKELENLIIDPKLNQCAPIEKVTYPYSFMVFDRLGAGPYQQQIFSYPKYPTDAYNWQYEPTASNVDIWTKETLRVIVLFPESCVSEKGVSLVVEIRDKEENKNSYSFKL